MIFKILTGDTTITDAIKNIKILGSTIEDVKRNLKTDQGVAYSLFGGNQIKKNDVDIIKKYVDGIKSGLSPAQSWNKNLKGCSVAAKQYVLETKKAGKSDDELIAGLKDIPKASKAAKIGMAALNAAITALATVAISALISGITKMIQAKEDARQAAIESINVYKDEKKLIEDQTKKYKELAEAIESGNLSTDEIVQKKEELLGIQNDLVDTFGDEAEGIDLVNGKYKEQLELLEKLSKQNASNIVTENKDEFEDAKKEIEKIRTYNIGRIASWSSTYDPQTNDEKRLIDYISSYSDLFETTPGGKTAHGETYSWVDLKVRADVENADKVLHDFAEDLRNFGDENNIDVSGILGDIGEQLNNTWTEKLTEYKEIYDEYSTALIMANDDVRSMYKEAIDAVEAYNNAIASGEGYEEAKTNLESVMSTVEALTASIEDGEDIWRVFQDIFDKKEQSREEIAADYKKKFGLNYNDKTLETFFANEIVDLDRFKRIADVTDNAVEAIKMYHEEVEKVQKEDPIISEESLKKAKTYRDELGKLYDALSLLRSGEATASDLYGFVEEFPGLSEYAGDLELLEDKIQELINKKLISLREQFEGVVSEEALQNIAKMSVMYESVFGSIDSTADSIDNLTSSYKSLNKAIEEYNKNGFVSIDTLEAFMKLEPQYLSSLFDEEGQLKDVTEVYRLLLKQKLKELEIDAYRKANYSQEQIRIKYAGRIGSEEYSAEFAASQKALEKELELIRSTGDNIDKVDLGESAFDKILKEFDNKLSHFENEARYIEAQLENAEARGYIANEAYYKALENVEHDNYDMLEEKLSKLNGLMANSNYDKNSDEWHKLQNEIEETTIAMQESLNTLVDLDNKMRQVDWDMFDFARNRESNFMEEADFLIDLMDRAEKFNEEMGSANVLDNLTKEGMATMGLHASNYNAYFEQSIEYSKELAELQEKINNDKGDTELLGRYDELLEKQQEAILSAESEKEAIISLVEEGINLQKDSFQDLIDEYTEALDIQKDLYDYQKRNAEQTKRIAQIQKQLAAYSGDNSDEARAKVQQLKVQLEEEQGNLEADQYDRYISDQKEILSSIQQDYEKALDIYLDDTARVITDSISEVNANAIGIGNTLANEAENVGYQVSGTMESIWTKKGGALATGFNGVSENVNAVNGTLTDIQTDTKKLIESQIEVVKSLDSVDSNANKIANNIKTTVDTISGTLNVISGKISSSKSKESTIDITAISKGVLTSISSMFSGTSSDKIKNIKEYASGGRNLNKQLAWTQENGVEYIIRPSDGAILTPLAQGDSVLTSEASKNLWNMANNPMEFIKDNLTVSLPNVTTNSSGGSVENNIHMSLSLPGVSNYQEFVTQLQADKKFEKMIVDVTSSAMTGNSSLSKYRHKF